MLNDIKNDELLLRAVYPAGKKPNYWENGHLSSAALKDSNGLSVERTANRSMEESVCFMLDHLTGCVISFSVEACNKVYAIVRYLPSNDNAYHCEVHGSDIQKVLSEVQAYKLSRAAKIEHMP